MRVPFHDLAGLSESEATPLRGVAESCRDLAEVMAWAREYPGYEGRETFVTQDEFTHDAVFPIAGGRYLVFGIT